MSTHERKDPLWPSTSSGGSHKKKKKKKNAQSDQHLCYSHIGKYHN